MEKVSDAQRLQFLEALEEHPNGTDDVPEVDGLDHGERMGLAEELEDRGLITVEVPLPGDGRRLLSGRGFKMTLEGSQQARRLREVIEPGPREPAALEVRRQRRFEFMAKLREMVAGDRFVDVDPDCVATALGWDGAPATMLDYLQGEGLIDFAFGGQMSITHNGIAEVEAMEADPGGRTPHFGPTVNIIGEVHPGGIVQQGGAAAQQTVVMREDRRSVVMDVLELVRKFTAEFLDGDPADEVQAEITAAGALVQSPRAPLEAIKQGLLRIAGLISAGALAGDAVVRAAELAEHIHRVVPGI